MDLKATEWKLYLIRCRDNTLYCGITTDVQRRFAEHQSGSARAARYLRGRRPLELAFYCSVGTRSQALRLEYLVKKQSRAVKEQLIKRTRSLDSLIPKDSVPD